MDESYVTVAIIRKEIFNFTDTYVIDVKEVENALDALMFVLAIDAEKFKYFDRLRNVHFLRSFSILKIGRRKNFRIK